MVYKKMGSMLLQSVRSSNASLLNKAPYSMQAAMTYLRSLMLYANWLVSILLRSQGVCGSSALEVERCLVELEVNPHVFLGWWLD